MPKTLFALVESGVLLAAENTPDSVDAIVLNKIAAAAKQYSEGDTYITLPIVRDGDSKILVKYAVEIDGQFTFLIKE